jgi:hypothetical protein
MARGRRTDPFPSSTESRHMVANACTHHAQAELCHIQPICSNTPRSPTLVADQHEHGQPYGHIHADSNAGPIKRRYWQGSR